MKRECLFKIIIFLLLTALFSIHLSCRGQKTETSSSKTNSPPVITSVNIQPEKLTKESELNLFIKSQDADGDSISYQYQWIRNNEEMTGENKNSLRRIKNKKNLHLFFYLFFNSNMFCIYKHNSSCCFRSRNMA